MLWVIGSWTQSLSSPLSTGSQSQSQVFFLYSKFDSSTVHIESWCMTHRKPLFWAFQGPFYYVMIALDDSFYLLCWECSGCLHLSYNNYNHLICWDQECGLFYIFCMGPTDLWVVGLGFFLCSSMDTWGKAMMTCQSYFMWLCLVLAGQAWKVHGHVDNQFAAISFLGEHFVCSWSISVGMSELFLCYSVYLCFLVYFYWHVFYDCAHLEYQSFICCPIHMPNVKKMSKKGP